jgi:hypothetical protein
MSNPRQIKVYLPWLLKLINQLCYTVYTVYKQTAGNQFSCIVYTHSTAKLLPLVETASPPRLDLSPGGPERGQLTPMPFSGVERPLKASVPPIPLQREFPCLVGHREGTLSRVWSRFQARAA